MVRYVLAKMAWTVNMKEYIMKLSAINPKVTPFKDGKTVTVGNWHYEDFSDLVDVRQVFHYSTLMGQFEDSPEFGWTFEPISVGRGSVSDQNGMNQIIGGEWRYHRSGGDPRYVAYDDVTVFRGFQID